MPEIRPSISSDCEFAVGTVWGTLSGYALVFAPDGNLELQGPTRLRLWESGTRNCGGRILSMQADGNLVIYDAMRSTVLWASHTAGNRGAHLAVQEDGNVVIYSNANLPIWATDTACDMGTEKLPEIEIWSKSAAAMPMRLAR